MNRTQGRRAHPGLRGSETWHYKESMQTVSPALLSLSVPMMSPLSFLSLQLTLSAVCIWVSPPSRKLVFLGQMTQGQTRTSMTQISAQERSWDLWGLDQGCCMGPSVKTRGVGSCDCSVSRFWGCRPLRKG